MLGEQIHCTADYSNQFCAQIIPKQNKLQSNISSQICVLTFNNHLHTKQCFGRKDN